MSTKWFCEHCQEAHKSPRPLASSESYVRPTLERVVENGEARLAVFCNATCFVLFLENLDPDGGEDDYIEDGD